MVAIAEDNAFDQDSWHRRFKATFDRLSETVGNNAFKRYSVAKGRHEGGFLVSQFEAVTCGVTWNLERGTLRDDLDNAIMELWSNSGYTGWVGAGITAARRLRRTIPVARKHFSSP